MDGNDAETTRSQKAAMDESLSPGFAAISGLDAARGLKHMRGRVHSYIRLLRVFAETRDADIEAMRGQLEGKNYAELSTLMHNIKGVSGFLGAMEIEDQAAEVYAAVRAGKESAEIERLAAAIMAAQARLAADVLELVGRSPKGESA